MKRKHNITIGFKDRGVAQRLTKEVFKTTVGDLLANIALEGYCIRLGREVIEDDWYTLYNNLDRDIKGIDFDDFKLFITFYTEL